MYSTTVSATVAMNTASVAALVAQHEVQAAPYSAASSLSKPRSIDR